MADHGYTYDNLTKIIKSAVQEFDNQFGRPDKIVKCYYETHERSLYTFVNQTRIYLNAQRILFVTEYQIIVIPFDKIIGYEIINLKDNNKVLASATTTVTKTDTGNMIKRAVIGGVLGGGVGAIIGGATAKTTSTTSRSGSDIYRDMIVSAYHLDTNLVLKIQFDDIINPVVKIHFEHFKEQAERIAESLNVIVKRNADNTEENSSEIIKKIFSVKSAGDKLGIAAQDPYAAYSANASSSGSSCLFVIALLLSTLGMLGLVVSCI